jgi:hypothetical protein
MPIAAKAGRPAGLPKTGGRKKGTPNRATLALRETFAAMGYDPLVEMAKMTYDKKNTPELIFQCHREIAPYIYPKRKPEDGSNHELHVINVNTNLDNPDDSSDGRDQSQSEAEAAPGSGL